MKRLEQSRVTVLGSINVDVSVAIDRFPMAGETLIAGSRRIGLGGKGANQAVAAAHSGARVTLIARVGADAEGLEMTSRLRNLGVDTARIAADNEVPTGQALIFLTKGGDNRIVVSPGANARLEVEDVIVNGDLIRDSDILVVQGEVPSETVRRALDEAEQAGVRCVINLAPILDLDASLTYADPLVVNEIEASQLFGVDIRDASDVRAHADRIAARTRSTIVTLGARGAAILQDGRTAIIDAPKTENVVDTTGAGDAFVGVIAARLASGEALLDAARIAVRYASESVGYLGAAESYHAH